MAIDQRAFFAESKLMQEEFGLSRDQADMLAAEKFWEGSVDEKMQPTQGEVISRRARRSGGAIRRIESIEDQMRGTVTYEIPNGQMVRFDARTLREYGLAALMEAEGLAEFIPTERVAVIHHGVRVGTMAPDFDPDNVRSLSFLYDPRPGDFKREGNAWVVARTLGPGDLDAISGFVRADRQFKQEG